MANIITCVRILCGAALFFCPAFSGWFYLVYFIGGISDVLDGTLARLLRQESERGAQLDTAADAVFWAAVLIILVRAVYLPPWIIGWIIGIALVKVINLILGFVRRRRFVTEHTLPNKICGILLFVIPPCVGFSAGRLPWQPLALLIIVTCAAASCAAVHESVCILTGKEIR